jgi:hypothetical protein
VVAVVVSGVGVGLGGIKFRNSGSDGQLLVWCPSLLHSAHGGGMRGGCGAVGSFFVLLPSVVAGGVGSIGAMGVGSIGAMGVGSIGAMGVLGVRTGIVMGSPACG